MSNSRYASILNHLATNGRMGLRKIKTLVNRDSGDRHPITIFRLDMYQLIHVRGVVQCTQEKGRGFYSLTRLGELVTSLAKSSMPHKKKLVYREQRAGI
ncbi:MAG: hypothetical protein WAV46_03090 [Candidatus Moraniibacteriota bacterium]